MQGSTVPTLGADPSTVSLEQQRAAYELEQQQPRALRRGAGEGTAVAVEQLPSMELAQMISPRPAETAGPEDEETTVQTHRKQALFLFHNLLRRRHALEARAHARAS